jgi:hypothetical protein
LNVRGNDVWNRKDWSNSRDSLQLACKLRNRLVVYVSGGSRTDLMAICAVVLSTTWHIHRSAFSERCADEH